MAACAAVALAAAAWAFDVARIAGGSMEPFLSRGDIVVAATWEPIRAGDVALFEDGGGLVVHRVAAVRGDGDVVTRGDANEAADVEPVAMESIRGPVIFVFRVGSLSGYVP